MTPKTIQEALREWMDASPNKTPRNTLVGGKFDNVIYYYWNLKPNDPHEKDFVWIEEGKGEP